MERFCDKCGTLVSGDGEFCPSCGARLESISGGSAGGIDLNKSTPGVEPMMAEPIPGPIPTPTSSNNTYQGQTNYAQMPVYPQNYNQTTSSAVNQSEMTVGNWVLTIFLANLGIIGLILLFVWGFSNDTPIAKKNFARAMLIWSAISYGLVILLSIIFPICLGFMGAGWDDIFDDVMYAMFTLR